MGSVEDQGIAVFLDAAPDAIVIVDERGTITHTNHLAEVMFGYGARDLLGQPIETLVPERFRRAHLPERAAYANAPRTRPMGAGKALLGLRRDGSEFPVEISLSPLRTPAGTQVISIVRDLTDRIKAELKFRGFIETAPDAVVIVDDQGRIAIVNHLTEKMFGYRRDELLGQPIELLVPERYHAGHVRDRDAYMRAPRTRPMALGRELRGRRKDGSEFPVEISLSPLDTEQGLLVTSIIRDTTARPFQVVVNAVKDFAILLLNVDGTVVSWNAGAQRIEGYTAEEIIGAHFSLFYPEPTDILERARRDGEASYDGWLVRKDGSRYWATVVISSHSSGFSMIVRDISERRAFEEQLRALSTRLITIQEEERKTIARDVHDELGQGLTALKLHVAALAQSLPAEAAEGARRDIERINDLIDENIHEVRRIAGELRPAAIDDFGLTAAVQLATENFTVQSGVECEVSIRPDEIQAPPTTAIVIYRILQEALTNVIRHAKATRVEVRLRQDERSVVLEVRDNGVGVTEEQLRRADALGLMGMRERASIIGGELRIEGVPGRGTIVSLRTPREAS